jgi:hypothetical protein
MPLTDEELAAEAHQAALDAAELAAARQQAHKAAISDRGLEDPCDEPVGRAPPATNGETERSRDGEIPTGHSSVPPSLIRSVPPSPPPLHNLHTESVLEVVTTPTAPCTCRLEPASEKNPPHTCIVDCDQPSWPLDTQARSASEGHRREAVVAGSELGSPDRPRTPAVA